MKKKYGIGLSLCVIIVVTLITFASYIEYEYMNSRESNENVTKTYIKTQGTASKQEEFIIKDLNGFVVVYKGDGKTIYEYTTIPTEQIPFSLREKIDAGLHIYGREKLYGFLENFTS